LQDLFTNNPTRASQSTGSVRLVNSAPKYMGRGVMRITSPGNMILPERGFAEEVIFNLPPVAVIAMS
jgi:hypothetical protein